MASLFLLKQFYGFITISTALMLGITLQNVKHYEPSEIIPIMEMANVDNPETASETTPDARLTKDTIPKGIILDLDGTLADVSHRIHHIRKKIQDKEAYHSMMGEDPLNHWCFNLLSAMRADQYKIIIITGRPEKYRNQTIEWLDRNKVIYDELYMRPHHEKKINDVQVKKTIYQTHIQGRIKIEFVVEDRRRVVDMWRELGLVCLQCAPGEF